MRSLGEGRGNLSEERFPLPSPDCLRLHLVNRRTVTLHAADGELVLDGAGVAASGLIVAVVFVEGAEPPLHTEDAAHDLAHAEVGGGEQHAAKEQQERPVDKQLVGFRIRAVRLPEKDEKTDGPHQPEQVAAGFQERLHRHPGIGVDLHEADPLFTAAFRAAGQIVGEDGLAAGALQFALDFDLDGSGGRRAARDQALAAERRFGPHAAASVVCVVRACCM